MEKLKQYKYIILITLVILGFAFYWFQLRPMIIKKNCSWFTQMEAGKPAIPAFAGVTKEEADKQNTEFRAKNGCNNNSGKSSFEIGLNKIVCSTYFSEQTPRPAIPAEPDKEVTREATKSEYDICLKHNGL